MSNEFNTASLKGTSGYYPVTMTDLHRQGLTMMGARQALRGEMVTNPDDRAQLAKLLSRVPSSVFHNIIWT